jgi:hypothetical protein
MLQQNTTKRIGYWLLHLHYLFDAATTELLVSENLTRRHWQVLHALSIKVDKVSDIDAAFAPFLAADGVDSYQPIVDDFAARGWVTEADGSLSLTQAGSLAHERAEILVNAHAAESLAGISEEEFLLTNDVLARIALNTENR